jgi:hypothetical protein
VDVAERWRENWRAAAPPGAVRAELPHSRAARAALRRSLGALPSGTPIVLSGNGPAAARRCRRLAAAAGIERERAYLAFPSGSAPAFLVEDARASVELFARTVLAAPPGARFTTAAAVYLAVLRQLAPWPMTRLIACGHLIVGRRR